MSPSSPSLSGTNAPPRTVAQRPPRRAAVDRALPLFILFISGLNLLVGCQSLRLFSRPQPAPEIPPGEKVVEETVSLPAKYSLRIAPYVFLSDREIQEDQPLFRELASLRDQVGRELQLPDSQTAVHVYLFADKATYEGFMKRRFPYLPARRAFFVAQEHALGKSEELLVYTYWSKHTRKDLRHELTHALLHGVIRDVPLWLDEGLAEFFEIPPDQRGINADHLRELQRDLDGTYRLDLSRLEGLTEVAQMKRPEYREAWAWVYLMLRGSAEGKEVLTDYLKQLRLGRDPGPLRPRLAVVHPEPEGSLRRHLDTLPLLAARAQR